MIGGNGKYLLKIVFFWCISTVMMPLYSEVLLPEDITLYQLTDRADFVFQGTVRKIEYEISSDGILNTFVSYDVEDVIKGVYQKPDITLRFVGGFIERNSEILQLSEYHALQLKKGDQGVMMVQGNDSVQCPLVGCSFGRFGFTQGYVVDAVGRMISMDINGNIMRVYNIMDLKLVEAGNGLLSKPIAKKNSNTYAALMDRHSFVAHLRSFANNIPLAEGARCESVRSIKP